MKAIMRAILMVRPEPGGIEIRDDKPTPVPGEGEVRIKVARAAICGTDRHVYHWDPSIHHLCEPGRLIPRTPGF